MGITQAQKYEILEHEIHNENYLDYSNGYRYRKIYGSV